MTTALDAAHLLQAARDGRILLTRDKGYPALHEAWVVWTEALGWSGPHGGIIQLDGIGVADMPVAAHSIDHALKMGWQPRGQMWLLNVRHGWKRALPGRSWGPWVPSPLDPAATP